MNRIIRSPWLWLTAAVLGVLVVLQFFMPNGGYEEVQTSTMVKHLRDGDIKSLTFVDGGDQQIKAELDNGDKVVATWVDGQQVELVDLAEKGVDDGEIDKFNAKVSKPSLLGSILATRATDSRRAASRAASDPPCSAQK